MATLSTYEQTVIQLKTNPEFALGFAIDNNYDEIKSKIFAKFGYNAPDRIALKNFIISKLKTTAANDVISAITGSKYLNEAANYTGGYIDYFKSFTPASNLKSFSLDALLSGLGAGLTAYASSSTNAANAGATGITSGLTQTEIDAINAEKAAAEAEAAAKKKRKTIIIIVSVIVVIIIIGMVVYFKKKK